MNIGCVLMAAGLATRFGENKLLYPIDGRSLLTRATQAAPPSIFARAVAVVSDAQVEAAARAAGYQTVWNSDPARGQGSSIALGTRAMDGMDAALFCVCDQPYLTIESVRRLLAACKPGLFCALSYAGRRGNPVLFPSDSFAALAALAPHETGRAVLSLYPDRLVLVEAQSPRELMDIDTKADLSR